MIIEAVMADQLKGLTFSHPFSGNTVLVGDNGSGKSAIAIAAMLTIMGYVPGTGKTNAEILRSYGAGDKLLVGVKLKAHRFDRQWARSAKTGSVSVYYYVDQKKKSKGQFIEALIKEGNPKIFDLSTFMSLSEKKKADFVFTLFPPGGDIEQIEKKMIGINEKVNAISTKVQGSHAVIARLTTEKGSIGLPAGTLASTEAEIEAIKKKLTTARESLQGSINEQVAINAKAQAREDAKAEEDRAAAEKAEAEKNKAAEAKPEWPPDTKVVEHRLLDYETEPSADRPDTIKNHKDWNEGLAIQEEIKKGAPKGEPKSAASFQMSSGPQTALPSFLQTIPGATAPEDDIKDPPAEKETPSVQGDAIDAITLVKTAVAGFEKIISKMEEINCQTCFMPLMIAKQELKKLTEVIDK